MVAQDCVTDAELLQQYAKIFVTTATGVEESGTYFLYRPSYSQFCVQTPKYLLPWQQGSAEDKL